MTGDSLRPRLQELMEGAGALIMTHRSASLRVASKDSNEIVTPADLAANELLVGGLRHLDPNIPIYTEETSDNKSVAATRWIVDPLDGTTPWVWGSSGFAVSVALERDGTIEIGAVYDPVMREFFYAERGEGATRNGDTVRTVRGVDRSDMFIVVDWGNSDDKRSQGLDYCQRFLLPQMFARRVVPQFAPALGLCRIAEGRIHALVCNDTWTEDHSAGALILREAGGTVSNFANTALFDHREFGVIATNEASTHESIVSRLRGDT